MHCKINRDHAAATMPPHNAVTGAGWSAGTEFASIHSTHGKPGDARPLPEALLSGQMFAQDCFCISPCGKAFGSCQSARYQVVALNDVGNDRHFTFSTAQEKWRLSGFHQHQALSAALTPP